MSTSQPLQPVRDPNEQEPSPIQAATALPVTLPPTGQEPAPQEPQPPQPIPSFADFVSMKQKMRERQSDQRFKAAFDHAVRQNPDLAGEAQRIGIETGLDSGTVERNIEKVRQLMSKRDAERLVTARGNTTLARMLQDPEFAAISHDDLANLDWWARVELAFERGKLQHEQSQLDWIRSSSPTGEVQLTKEQQERLDWIGFRLTQIPETEGFLPGSAEIVGQQVISVPKAIATGVGIGAAASAMTAASGVAVAGPQAAITLPGAFVTGFAAGAAGSIYLDSVRTEGGAAYRQMRDAGIPHDISYHASRSYAVVAGLAEVVGVGVAARAAGFATKPLRAALLAEVQREMSEKLVKQSIGKSAWSFAKRAAATGTAEVGEEIVQETANVIADDAARVAAGQPSLLATVEGRIQEGRRIANVAIKAAQGMALLSLPGPGFHFLQESYKASKAKQTEKFFTEMHKHAVESKNRERNPKSYQEYVASTAKGTEVETTYVNAEVLADLLNQSGLSRGQIENALPGVLQQIDSMLKLPEDTRSDVNVSFKTADYAANVAAVEGLGTALLPHMKLDPDAKSAVEAEKFEKDKQEMQQEAEQKLDEKEKSDKEFVASAKAVLQDMQQQLQAAGRKDKQEVALQALFYRDWVVVNAARVGMSPEEFHQQYGVRILPKGEKITEPTVEQTAQIAAGKETLKRFGLDPDKRHTTREVAAALEARQRAKFGTIAKDDRSPESARRIANWMSTEVEFELERGADAIGWYSTQFQQALDELAVEFPEFKDNKTARDTFTAIIAITSDGQAPFNNLAHAVELYRQYKTKGDFAVERGGPRNQNVAPNLEALRKLIDKMGADGARDYLLQELPIKQLKKTAAELGTELESEYQVHLEMPMAAVFFGPKIGAFYANLMGKANYLTMDRWWSRTFNRYRGNLLQKATPQGIARVRKLLGNEELSDDEVLAATVPLRKSYEKKGFKNGTELEVAANTVWKAAFMELEDTPFNPSDRTFMIDAVRRAQKSLARKGHQLSLADIQAILWYYEKRLYGSLGAKSSTQESFLGAARRFVAARGGSTVQGRPGAAEEAAGEGAGADTGAEPFTGQQPGILRQPRPDAGSGTGLRAGPGTAPRPVYGEARPGSTRVVGVHFSREPRTELDSAQYGTGLKGGESRRVAGDPLLDKRIYLYVDTGTGIQPEMGVGLHAHDVQLENVYNTEQDPLGIVAKWQSKENLPNAEVFNGAEREIIEAGFDGLFVPRAQQGQGVVVLIGPKHSAVPVRSVVGVLEQPARGGYAPSLKAIVLNENPDPSTVLHEFSHHFLVTQFELASQPNPHPQIAADAQTILNWFGVKDLATWNAMPLEAQRRHHEAFAFNFEKYLALGEAPSPRLKTLFQRVRDWLMQVYDSIVTDLNALYRQEHGRDLPFLTPEVRLVFDRMFAADQQVRRAAQIRAMVPKFQTQEQSGMNDAEWDAYQKLADKALDDAIDEHTQKSLQDMRWLTKLSTKILKTLHQEADSVRAAVRAEVEAQLKKAPVYRAQHWLKTGVLLGADGEQIGQPDEQHKLDTEAVQALMPEGVDASKLGRVTKKGGVDPDAVAKAFDYNSGDEMVRALLAAPPLQEAVTTATDARMMRDYAELVDPGQIARAVEAALHNEASTRLVATELRALTKGMQPVSLMIQAAKEAARRQIEQTPVSGLRPHDHALAEARAGREALAALAAGKPQEAVSATRRQLLQGQLWRASTEARAEVQKLREGFARFDRTDKKTAAQRQIDLVYAGRALLAAFQAREGPRTAQEADLWKAAMATVQTDRPALWARIEALMPAPGASRNVDSLTVREFRELAALANSIWAEAKQAKELVAEDTHQSVRAVADELSAQVGKAPARGDTARAEPGRTPGAFRRTVLKGWHALSALKRVEHWTWFMDGNQDGPFAKYLVQPVMRRLNAYWKKKAEVIEKIHAKTMSLARAKGAAWDAPIEAPELGGFTFRGAKELIGALLHIGNFSSLAKLLRGHKGRNGLRWGDMIEGLDGEEVLDTSKWDRFLDRMHQEKRITAADYEYVRSVWAIYAEILPEAQKSHKKLYGYEFETLELKKVNTPFGSFEGGYVPARVDQDMVDVPRPSTLVESIENLEHAFQYSISTGKGFTLARNPNYNQPLALNLAKQVSNIDEELRFVYVQPVVKDALKIINDRTKVEEDGTVHVGFRNVLDDYDRQIVNSTLMPWLDNTARQATSQRSTNPFVLAVVDPTATFLRSAASLAALGFNLMNAAIQATGLTNAFTQTKGRYVRGAIAQWATSPVDTFALAREKSTAFARRLDRRIRKIEGELARQSSEPLRRGIRAVDQTLSRWAFMPQRMVQSVMDVITWTAAYQQAQAELSTVLDEEAREAAAVERADGAMRRGQGSQNPEDLAAYAVTTPFMRLFLQFGDYSNVILNQILSSRHRVQAFAWAVFMPALIESTIRWLLASEKDDDDDDKYLDDYAKMAGTTIARNIVGLVPGGPMLLSLGQSEGDRLAASPAGTTIQGAARGIFAVSDAVRGEGRFTGADARNLGTLLTLTTGMPLMPVFRALGYQLDVEAAKQQPSNAIDYGRGLLLGR